MAYSIKNACDPVHRLTRILQKPISTNLKIQLIQSLKFELISCSPLQPRGQVNNPLGKCEATRGLTPEESMVEEENQLIDRILMKQRNKIELDEEIETTVDDLFEFQKVIATKKKYHEGLADQIQISQSQIQLMESKKEERSRDRQGKKQKAKGFLQRIFG